MATTKTVEGIDLLVPSPWDRDTIADGVWLNSNSIEPIFNNDSALAYAIAKSSAAVMASASRIYWEDEGAKTVKDLTFRNRAGSSYDADFDDSQIDAHMVIPTFNESSHDQDRELWFGWNKDNGFNFYDAEHINSGCKNPDVSGSNYIKVEKVANPDGHDTYSASLIPSKFRSWRNGNVDVGNILIQEREVGNEKWIEFSAGAPAQGGGSTIYETAGSSQGQVSTPVDLNYTPDNSEPDAVRVKAAPQGTEDWSNVDTKFVWPMKAADQHNDDQVWVNRNTGKYGWMDVSGISRVSIGIPIANPDILTVI